MNRGNEDITNIWIYNLRNDLVGFQTLFSMSTSNAAMWDVRIPLSYLNFNYSSYRLND